MPWAVCVTEWRSRMESSHSARCCLKQICIPRKMDSPSPASDSVKEGWLVLLLISVAVSFAWRKEELNKSVPGAVHLCTIPYTGPVTVVSEFCMMTTKLVWLLPMIQWWNMVLNQLEWNQFTNEKMCSSFVFLLSEVTEYSRSPAEAWQRGNELLMEVYAYALWSEALACHPDWSSLLVHSQSVGMGHQHAGEQQEQHQRGEETLNGFHVVCMRRCSCLMQSIEIINFHWDQLDQYIIKEIEPSLLLL